MLNEKFLSRMKNILKDDYDDFLSALSCPIEKAIYVNNKKIDKTAFEKIVDFDISQIPYETNGFYVDDEKKGRHPFHHAGAFYMQEPSAMFTVNCLKFKGDEIVLDFCASPGGKSIQIANRIPNGILISNEIVKPRSEILFSNIERMGLTNVIVTNDTPENLSVAYANEIDVCLVDAPCSGEGMFRRGDEVANQWNENLPAMCAKRQLDILESANKVLKTNGYLIYSTCTYSLEENEEVIKEFLARYNYQLVPFEHNFSKGIDMPKVARLYPHQNKGEGQFVALLQKLEENNFDATKKLELKRDLNAEKFLKIHTKLNENCYFYRNFSYIVKNLSTIKQNVNYVSIGVRAGENEKNRFEPNHQLFSCFGKEFKMQLNFKFNSKEVGVILHGDVVDVNLPDGYGAVLIDGCPLTGFKMSKGKFKNLYPKGLRNFK